MLNSRAARVLSVSAFCLTLFGSSASAQYFGRNKVHYKKFDFQILRTDHFDIYYYPEEREGIDIAARMSERWHARLERLLEHTLGGRQALVLYGSHPDFEQTNVLQGELGEGTGGVTESIRRRIILPMGGPLADTDHVIGHELVHAFQFDITTPQNAQPGRTGAEQLPLWFIEGMAEYLSIGPVDPNTAMWLRDRARQEKLPTIDELDSPKYFPYRWGQAFWAYVGGRFGDDVIGPMLRMGGSAGDPDVAIERVLGVTTKELSADWHDAIRRSYAPVLAAATPASAVGRVVIKAGDSGGDLNIGPAISPDGRWIAFLSERTLFSIDLFVADASTGKVVRKLTSTATDPHYSSIQFIHSAGAWDATSRTIAIATVASGRPAVVIFDALNGNKEREIPLPELDEIFNPAWSPDGRALVFTGMTRGLTDLFVYDLAGSALRRLTNDPFAELTPSWSPDGRRIAFATDRFSSNLNTLNFGPYRLALVDPATGDVEQVGAFTSGKHINPQWAPDSRSLFFISDRDGIPNLYRVTLGGDVSQLTRVGTGLSGITSSSPVLSVATETGVVCFTVYENGKYDIYAMDAAQRGGPPAPASLAAATLPPLDRRRSEVAAILENAAFGLPPDVEYPSTDYKPTLALEGLAQPTLAVGADRFGAALGGGIALQFSDMLGDHTLVAAVQLNSGLTNNFSLKNTAAQAGYFNQANRWNWGIVGGQIPYLSGGYQSQLGTIQGQPVQVDRLTLFRQTERSASAIAAYPFNRAQRIEFQTGVTNISFDQIVQTSAFSLRTGQLLSDDIVETSLGRSLALGTTSAALVYDTSNFGATSPVQGQRYRFEAAPAFGSVRFASVLADYRRYFMPVSFYTIATRVLHYGRYGSGGQDDRLFPLFIGYPNLVRGYDIATFDAAECVANAASDCPALERLTGSRLMVANLELRFPLLRPFGVSQSMYGPIPVEIAFFADGGVAWNRGEKPSLLGGERRGVTSAGVAFRVNLLGFAIGQFNFTRPFQRETRGWVFQFNLSPGF